MNRCLPLAWLAGQAAVIADAQDVVDVEADTIGYVEAHGTGTALGDPNVAAALTEALSLPDALALARGTAPFRVAPPCLPVVSPRTGDWMTEGESRDPNTWTDSNTWTDPNTCTGSASSPHALDAFLDGTDRHTLHLTPQDGEPAGHAHLLTLAAGQWMLGADLDFAAVHTDRDIRRVLLPTHRFERRRHWVEPGDHATAPAATPSGDRLIARFDPEDPHQNVELVTDYLTEEVGKVLGGRHLAALDTNLFDLGLDSLVLIEVVAELGEQLDFEVPAATFVEFPTIRSFVDSLADLMGLAPATTPGGGTTATATRTSRRAQRAAARRPGV